MTNTGLSEKLGELTLRPRQDLEVSRHVFGSKVTYILRDPLTFESHRLTVEDYEIFVQLCGGNPLQETFKSLVNAKTIRQQDEEDYYQFAVNLVQLGLIGLPAPDGQMLYHRAERRRLALRNGVFKNFLFQQIPLINPDRFLDRTIHLVRFVYSKWFVALWACCLLAALTIVLRRWSEFTDPLADILTLRNIPLLWSVLFGLKVVHEFGHAYACKHYGGKVPAMGLYLIAGNPCAFVDASAAWGFPSRFSRIVVSVGGMYVESIVGIIAVFVWAFSNSPALSSCAHHIVFMATAVTLLFNANPLMKYDGYFILCDLTGSPNLRQRSQNELNNLMKRYVLGLRSIEYRPTLRSLLLIAYGLAASVYKVVVVISISSMVATRFAMLGLAMGGYYAVSTVYGIYSKTLEYLWWSPEVRPVQARATGLGYAMLAMLPLLLLTPIPTGTHSTGRVTTQNEIEISNETPGIVKAVFAEPGEQISLNQPIVRLENESVYSQSIQNASELDASLLLHRAELEVDRSLAAKTLKRIDFLNAQLRVANENLDQLNVKANHAGIVTNCLPKREVGQYLPAGSTIAKVGSGPWIVKLLATSETMTSSRPQVGQTVTLRLQSQPKLLRGTIVSIAKAGDPVVESESLTHLAGGEITVNPATGKANETFFEIAVRPEIDAEMVLKHGMTADVRIDRKLELIGQGIYRRVTKFINQVLTS